MQRPHFFAASPDAGSHLRWVLLTAVAQGGACEMFNTVTQQAVLRNYRHHSAEKATSCLNCSCSGGERRTKVWPHHSVAPRLLLAASSPEDQVQDRHNSIQMPAWIGASLPGRWLSCNFCYRQQATSPVCWHQDTVRAKNDDSTEDEEFCGRRPTHLEQSASCPLNCKALSISQEPPIWLGLTVRLRTM